MVPVLPFLLSSMSKYKDLVPNIVAGITLVANGMQGAGREACFYLSIPLYHDFQSLRHENDTSWLHHPYGVHGSNVISGAGHNRSHRLQIIPFAANTVLPPHVEAHHHCPPHPWAVECDVMETIRGPFNRRRHESQTSSHCC